MAPGLGLSLGGMAVGSTLVLGTAQLIEPLLPALDVHALAPSGALLTSMLIWPVALAASVALLPLATCMMLPPH